MMTQIRFTLIKSKDPLNKLFKANGEKVSRGNMFKGNFAKCKVDSVEKLLAGFKKFSENTAITLGVPELDKGEITTATKVAGDKIARTKKYFKFPVTAFLLLDYDPSKNGYEIKDPKHFAEVLRDIDPALNYCDIGVVYGSSYGIYKDGVLISSKKSMHSYIIVDNATNEKVTQYKDYLVSEAWAKGYGHIELSKTGSVMRRQVFDSAVFSPERLIFEAAPTLEEGITRIVPEYEIFYGEQR